MKKHIIIAALATSAMFISCGDKEKKSEGTDNKDNVEEVVSSGFKFENIVRGMDNPLGAISISLNQLVEKSGIKDNPEYGPNVGMALGMASTFGVDLNNRIFIAANGTDAENMQVYAMTELTNSSMLASQIESISRDGIKDFVDGYKIAKVKDQNAVLIFNDNRILAVFTSNYTKKSEMESYAKTMLANAEVVSDKYAQFEGFDAMSNDLSFVYGLEGVMEMLPEAEKQKMLDENPKIMEIYKGSEMKGGLDFLNGKMSITADYAFPAMADYNMMSKDAISSDFASVLTNDKLFAVITAKYNIAGFAKYIEDFMPAKSEEDASKQKEIMRNISMLSDYLTGEAALSMIEVPEMDNNKFDDMDIDSQFDALDMDGDVEIESEVKENFKKADFKGVVVALGVKDEAGLLAVLDTVQEMKKSGNIYEIDNGKVYLAVKNNKLLLSPSMDVIKEFGDKGILKASEKAAKYIKPGMNGMFDFEMIAEELASKEGSEEALKVLKMLKNIEMRGDLKSMKFDLNLKNDSENALKVIVNSIIGAMSGVEEMAI